MIYLDNAATTNISETVLEAMKPYLTTDFGNPSSAHKAGRMVRQAIDNAREQVASALGAMPDEIYFTSGGTEADNWAIKGAAFASAKRKKLVTSAIEHPAVLQSCAWLSRFGYGVTALPVDENGFVNLDNAATEINNNTCLVTVMAANNEIGTVQKISKISEIANENGALMHTDAVQAVGAIPVNVNRLGVDMLSLSGHKLHAPKGIGALYIRRGVKIETLIHGGGQEQGKRSGTENVASIVGLGVAITEAVNSMADRMERMNSLRRLFFAILKSDGVPYKINGTANAYERLPNNINVSFPNSLERNIPMRLDFNGIAVSSGSACSAGKDKASHVLLAIGCNDAETKTSVRITLGDQTTEADIIELCKVLSRYGGVK